MKTNKDHKNLPTREFQAEVKSQATLELISCFLLKSDDDKQHAILVVEGQQQRSHQGFQPPKSEAFRVLATRSQLAAMLQYCLQYLEETPDHRIADALEKSEKHLEQIASSVRLLKETEPRSDGDQS